MKFVHFADCHLGGWRDEKLRNLSFLHFQKVIDFAIEKEVNFVLLSGDLFNTSLPGIDILRGAIREFKKLKEHKIPLFFIAGSHDFSPSGKSMLDVIEEAGLGVNVMKGLVEDGELHLQFTKAKGAKITGLIGKRGMLEKSYYEQLNTTNLESETGFKIFLFHTAISELKPNEFKDMDSAPLSLLPKGFDYYAGGHVHIVQETNLEGYKNIVYPGPVFPNSFSELEKLERGGFYFFDEEPKFVELPIPLKKIVLNCDGLAPDEVEFPVENVSGKIVLIRAKGKLRSGKPTDLKLREYIRQLLDEGALSVMKNTSMVETKEFEEIYVHEDSVDKLEKKLIVEHLGQNKALSLSLENEKSFTEKLFHSLAIQRAEGETVQDFQNRLKDETKKIISELDL